MITKAQATELARQHSDRFCSRVSAALEASATMGVIGGTFSYTGIVLADAQAAATKLRSSGWTVVVDGPTETAGVS